MPSLDRTYEGLKHVWRVDIRHTGKSCLDRTYEGLKLWIPVIFELFSRSLDRTYEGLKQTIRPDVSTRLRTRLDRTYEGLKLLRGGGQFNAAGVGLDRTYEGLKPVLPAAPATVASGFGSYL